MLNKFFSIFILLTLLSLSLACGGGGGGGSEQASISTDSTANNSTTQAQNVDKKAETTLRIDISKFDIFRNKKPRSKTNNISQVKLTVSSNGSNLFQDLQFTKITDTIYEIKLNDLPLNQTLTFEIKAEDSNGKTILSTKSETILTSNPSTAESNSNQNEISVPVSAIVEFEGVTFTDEEVKEIIGKSAESTETGSSVVSNETQTITTEESTDTSTSSESNSTSTTTSTSSPLSEETPSTGTQNTNINGDPKNTNTPNLTDTQPDNTESTTDKKTSTNDNSGDTTTSSTDTTKIKVNLFLIQQDENGSFANNAPQRFKSIFKEDHVQLTPEAKSEPVLEMTAISYGRSQQIPLLNATKSTNGSTVEYQYQDVKLWYINDSNGLEQGFTINKKPSGTGLLEVKVAMKGIIEDRGDYLHIHNPGSIPYSYSGLKTWDKNNKTLASHFKYHSSTGELSIFVDDSTATYPITIDPLISQAAITVLDSDNNGKIDSIAIAYPSNITGGQTSTSGFTVTYNSGAVTISGASSSGNTKTLTIDENDVAVDTSATNFQVTYTSPASGYTELGVDQAADIAAGAVELDGAKPVVVSVDFSTSSAPGGSGLSGQTVNSIKIAYSEAITITAGASTASFGAMTTAKTLAGIGSWLASSSDLTNNAATDNYTALSGGNVLTVYINAQSTGYFSAGSTGPANGETFTPIASASALTDSSNNTVNTATKTATRTTAWDVTKPTISNTYSIDSNNNGDIDMVAIEFSEAIFDNSFTASNFSVDNDSNSGNGGDIAGATANTNIDNRLSTNPDGGGVSNDKYYEIRSFASELAGTSIAYLHHKTAGLRDLAGNRMATADGAGTEADEAQPVVESVTFSTATAPSESGLSGNSVNTIQLVYSEIVTVSTGDSGAGELNADANKSLPSTSSMGAMTTAKTLEGLGSWNGTSNMSTAAATDNYLVLSGASSNILTVYVNAQSAGYFSAGSIGPSTDTFTPSSSANDVKDAAGLGVNTQTTTAAVSTSWDVTSPTDTVLPSTSIVMTTFNSPTIRVRFSETVTTGSSTSHYSFSGNAAYKDLLHTFLDVDSATLDGSGNYNVQPSPTSHRLKSGNFIFSIDGTLRDTYGNRYAGNTLEYTVRATNVAQYQFNSGTAADSYSAVTGGFTGAFTGAGATAITDNASHIIDGPAVQLNNSDQFTVATMDQRNFPQEDGTVFYWYKPGSSPATTDQIFGDASLSGNHISVNYIGSGNVFRLTAHGIASSNTIDFNLTLNKWNHIAFTWSDSSSINLHVNAVQSATSITTNGWSPSQQDFIIAPKGQIDNVRIYDTVRTNTNIKSYFIPLTRVYYTFDGNTLDHYNDFDLTTYQSPGYAQAHHLISGNSIHLRHGMGFDATEYGKHLFPHFDTGTIHYWINPNPVTDQSAYLLDAPDENRDHVYIRSSGNENEYIFVFQNAAASSNITKHFDLEEHAWNHLGITWNTASNINFYVNGNLNLSSVMNTWSVNGQIISTTPNGYIDDFFIETDEKNASFFSDLWLQYTTPSAYYSFENSGVNVPLTGTDDIGTLYTTDASENRHRMFIHGGTPTLKEPHYGVTSANSLLFSANVGFSINSLDESFFPIQDGTLQFWLNPHYITGGSSSNILDTFSSNTRNQFFIRSIDSGGNYQFGLVDPSNNTGVSGNITNFSPIMERWNHFAITWTSNNGSNASASFYLNGNALLDSMNIQSWRPDTQHVTSTPHGIMDELRIDNYRWTKAQVQAYYNTYIKSLATFGFSQAEMSGNNSYSGNLMAERNNPNPTNFGIFSDIHRSTEGHHDALDDVDLTGGQDTSNIGAQEFRLSESFWVPSLDKTRFPQDEGTLRFWVKPIPYQSGNAYIFDHSTISATHKNFFYLEAGSEEGYYNYGIYNDGSLIGSLTNIELHAHTFNYISVTWKAGGDIRLYINGQLNNTTTMNTWRPSDQLFVSIPQGVLDMMYLENTERSASFINDYFLTYVTPAGLMTFEGGPGTELQITDQTSNLNAGSSTGTIVTATGFHSTSNNYLNLTAANSSLSIPSLVKDLFPQQEGVIRFWYYPNPVSNSTTYVFDEPDPSRKHFYIQSQSIPGYYRFAIQEPPASGNLAGYYDFYIRPLDWSLVSVNWSSDRGDINLHINGELQYTTNIGSWRPEKQFTSSTPSGLLDDFYVSYQYESSDNIQDYYEVYRTTEADGSLSQWGDGLSGQLGDGNSAIVSIPSLNHNFIHATTVAGGDQFGAAILRNTHVQTWGENTKGVLGNGTTNSSSLPTDVPLVNGAYDLDCGKEHIVVCLVNGNVLSWGSNSKKQLGHSDSLSFSSSPGYISGLSNIKAVASGNEHSIALDTGGNVFAWGNNEYGQLGSNASGSTVLTPVLAYNGATTPAIAIASGMEHNMVLLNDGSILSWGRNNVGQLGNNSTTDSTTTVSPSSLPTTVTGIACGDYHSLVLLSNGNIMSWGKNTHGQLGNATNTNSSNPVYVYVDFANSQLGSVTQVACGAEQSYALLSAGNVKAWGKGTSYELGNGVAINKNIAVDVTATEGIIDLGKPGPRHIQTIIHPTSYYGSINQKDVKIKFDNNSTLDTGKNNFNATFNNSPTLIAGYDGSGNAFLFNSSEELNIPTLSGNVFPQDEGTIRFWFNPNSSSTAGASIFDTTDTSRNHFHFVYDGGGNIRTYLNDASTTSTTLLASFSTNIDQWSLVSFSWQRSSNTINYAINGTTTTSTHNFGAWKPSSQLVHSAPTAALDNLEISSTFFSSNDLQDEYTTGTNASSGEVIKAWGSNSFGELGDGTTTNRKSPVTVSGYNRPLDINLGLNHKLVLYSNGELKASGTNDVGQLGDGTNNNSTSLVTVSKIDYQASKIAAGATHNLVLMTDGTVKAWGSNFYGQLGINSSITSYPVPKSVTTLSNITAIACGLNHCLALTSSGNVYAWGENSKGQLGIGTTTNAKKPTLINLTNVSEIACGSYHSIARLNDGTVRAWGFNQYGQLGDGTTTDRTSSVTVTGLTGVQKIYSSTFFNLVFDGSNVKGWGRNRYGQLGQTPPTVESSVVTLSGLSGTVSEIAVGDFHAIALLTTGNVLSWGRNHVGQLGHGTLTDTSTPTVIPNLDNVLNVSAKKSFNFSIGQ